MKSLSEIEMDNLAAEILERTQERVKEKMLPGLREARHLLSNVAHAQGGFSQCDDEIVDAYLSITNIIDDLTWKEPKNEPEEADSSSS